MRSLVTPGPATIGSAARMDQNIQPAVPATASAAMEKARAEQRPRDASLAGVTSHPLRAG